MKYPIELRKNQAILAIAILFSPVMVLSYDRIMDGVDQGRECRVYHASAPAEKRCDNSPYKN
jgi:hypothetical protein